MLLNNEHEDHNPLEKYSNSEGEVVRNLVTTYIKYNLPDHLVPQK